MPKPRNTPVSAPTALAGAVLALGLAGCASDLGTYSASQVHVEPRYKAADFRLSHAGKPLPVVVHGGAFGLAEDRLAAEVADALRGRTPVARTEPVAAAPQDAGISRVVVQVNPPVTASRFTLCAGEKLDESVRRDDGRTVFLMAYCYDDRPRSAATLTLRASGPEDPAFRNGIGLAGMRMFPARNPESRPDKCQPIC